MQQHIRHTQVSICTDFDSNQSISAVNVPLNDQVSTRQIV